MTADKNHTTALIWRFIVAYKHYNGTVLAYTTLNRQPQLLHELVQQIMQDAKAPDQLKTLAENILQQLESDQHQNVANTVEPLAEATKTPPSFGKTQANNFAFELAQEEQELPANHHTYKKIISFYLKSEQIYLKERQILDQLIIDEGLSDKVAIEIENNERRQLRLNPLDWEKEFLFSYHQLTNQENQLEQDKVALYSTYVRHGRLSLNVVKAIVHEYKTLKRPVTKSKAKWWVPIAALFFVTIGAAIASLQHFQNPDSAGLLTVKATEPTPIEANTATTYKSVQLEPLITITGSNTIGAKLGPNLAKLFLSNRNGSAAIRAGESENEYNVETLDENQATRIQIKAHGSSSGINALLNASTDIAAASRPIKAEEISAIVERDNSILALQEYVIGLDGIAIIVNPSNPIKTLNKALLADIFSGKITHWESLNTNLTGEIHVIARNNQSGTYETFKTLVLGEQSLSIKTKRYESNDDVARQVYDDPLAIGFVALPAIAHTKVLSISDGDGYPFYPTAFTIATEDYPLTRRLFFYTNKSPKPIVSDFISLVLSDQGQALVQNEGFIDMRPTLESVESAEHWPTELKSNLENAQRLSLNFRFTPSTIELDTRAQQDLERVTQYLTYNAAKNKEVLLFGFSDSIGDAKYNQYLSQQRAQMVADELMARGITPSLIVGLGSAAPVATNQTPDGREKNRRVEIWLR